ncbi:unannotated protein [freshwater metagenome]|uniref:Unannotated protein n=1 Tax=freshwater metagenome TaxID=449393 RepID=A0A6J6I7S2_9ZZZZ
MISRRIDHEKVSRMHEVHESLGRSCKYRFRDPVTDDSFVSPNVLDKLLASANAFLINDFSPASELPWRLNDDSFVHGELNEPGEGLFKVVIDQIADLLSNSLPAF